MSPSKPTKPTKLKQAAALKYDVGENAAPVAVAIGQGVVAENIIEAAQEHAVPIVEDEQLAAALSRMGVGDEIPVELYMVVAQVLTFVHSVDGDYAKKVHKAHEIRNV